MLSTFLLNPEILQLGSHFLRGLRMLGVVILSLLVTSLMPDSPSLAVAILMITPLLILFQGHFDPGSTRWIWSGRNQGGGGGTYRWVDWGNFHRLAISPGMCFRGRSVWSHHMVMWGRGRLRWEEALKRGWSWVTPASGLFLSLLILSLLK